MPNHICVLKKSYSGLTNRLDYIIYICLCFYLVIDSITGFLLYSGTGGISAPYKFLVLLLMILSISLKNMQAICFIVFMFSFMFLSFFVHLIVRINWSFGSISMPLQLINNQVYFIYFYFLLKSCDNIEKYTSNNFLKMNICVFLFNIILGVFGFGFYMYDWAQMGIKGFFYAGNQASVLFFCLYFIVLVRISNKSNKILCVYAIALIISYLMMTRVAVLSCAIISCVDYYFRSSKKRKYYLKLFSPVLVIVLIVLLVFFVPETRFFQFFNERTEHSLRQGRTLIDALLASRAMFLIDNYNEWKIFSSSAVIMFGLGATEFPSGRVEIDLFDTFFHLGIFFTLFALFYYVILICLSIKIKNGRLFFFNMLYLSISMTAGHVWYSVMAGLFFAYINAYEIVVYLNKKSVKPC